MKDPSNSRIRLVGNTLLRKNGFRKPNRRPIRRPIESSKIETDKLVGYSDDVAWDLPHDLYIPFEELEGCNSCKETMTWMDIKSCEEIKDVEKEYPLNVTRRALLIPDSGDPFCFDLLDRLIDVSKSKSEMEVKEFRQKFLIGSINDLDSLFKYIEYIEEYIGDAVLEREMNEEERGNFFTDAARNLGFLRYWLDGGLKKKKSRRKKTKGLKDEKEE